MQAEKSQIAAIREFNRFYTRHLGLLDEGLLASEFNLTQARVLFELGSAQLSSATEISKALGIDSGYLSRILQKFIANGLLVREQSEQDARSARLVLSALGKAAFRDLDRASAAATQQTVAHLGAARTEKMLAAMRVLRNSLDPAVHEFRGEVVIRPYTIGDIGWAIEQHGKLYADEYGWNGEFEALVATLFGRFASQHDPRCEQCWVAELDGDRVGCVFVVRNDKDPEFAQLRCLLVTPEGRGFGIGQRLVETCMDFASRAGYRKMMLWTNSILDAALHIYRSKGFEMVEEESHFSFGHHLVSQIWTRKL